MSTNVEIYRAWEKAPPSTVCHVLIIEPVGGVVTDRITLTDKPYYDYGVDGQKYHHTYPAPIQCITSDLETRESRESTSFADIKIIDVAGRLAGLATRGDLRGAVFTVLRGDTRWSLLETDFPNRFIDIYKGTVSGVMIESEGPIYSISLGNVAANLTRKIGTIDAPVSYGSVFNVPAVLVDSATDRHRVDTRHITTSSSWGFELRDGGSVLLVGGANDFVEVLENSEFRGLIELNGGPPIRDLTATFERTADSLYVCINQVLQEYVFENTRSPTADVSPFNVNPGYCFNDDESVMFTPVSITDIFFVTNHYFRAYDFGTPGLLSSLPADVDSHSEQIDIGAYFTSTQLLRAKFSYDGTKLYLISTANEAAFHQWDLAAPWTLTGASYYGTGAFHTLDPLLAIGISSFEFSMDGSKLFLLNEYGSMFQLDCVDGDVDTLSNAAELFHVTSGGYGEEDKVTSFHFSPDRSKAYFYRQFYRKFLQYELPDPESFTGGYFCGRSVFLLADDSNIIDQNETMENLLVSITGNKFYRRPGATSLDSPIYAMDCISGFDLPYENFTSNRPEGFFNNPLLFKAGAFFNNETSSGDALSFLISSMYAGYSINRFGSIQSVLLTYPSSYPDPLAPDVPVYAIGAGDFIGERGAHIRHTETERELRAIDVRYKKNYRPQGRSELAGIAEDYADLYGRPYSLSEFSGPSDEGDEIVIDSAFFDDAEASFFGWVMENWGQSYAHEITIKLSSVTLLSDFGLGSIVSLDTRYISEYPTFGKALVIGRDVNWSKNTQKLLILST